jgi:hypothetical protein
MPNWKKVIVSGSDAALNSVTTPNGVLNTFSASYALTASYALNGGTGGSGISAIYIADEGNLQGTASYFDFNGAGVTATISNGTASITIPGGGGSGDTNSSNAILSQTVAATTWSFDHNLSTLYPVFTIYDANDDVIIPQKIHTVNTASALIYFSSARTGTAVASKGGNVVTASAATSASYALRATSASYAATATSASYSVLATSASYAVLATSASYAISSSYSLSGSYAVTASYAATASSADSFNVRTSLTASGLIYPTTDGTLGQVVITDGAGNLSFSNVENTTIIIKNVSGATIIKGTPCYITGSGNSGNMVGVYPADASNPLRMPVGVIAGETLTNESEGIGLINGFISGVDTSAFASGDSIYVAAGGGYTNIRPTGSSILVQKLGNVEKSHISDGSGVINGPGYYNDLPNIQSGYTWVGNSNGVAVAITTSSIQNVISASNAQTASYADNFTVQGTLTAQTLVVQTITSSVEQVTGSTQFGSIISNTHQFTGSVSISGSLQVNGSDAILSNQTSSMSVATASYVLNAVSASYATSALTASYAATAPYSGLQGTVPTWNQDTTGTAATASYVLQAVSASFATNALTASYASNVPETASYALVALTASYASNVPVTASYALNANTASYALTASYISGSGAGVGFPFSGSAVITGSLFVSSSFISGSFTGSLEGTASYATFALSASNAPGFTTNKTQSTPAVTWSFVHNLNTRNPLLQVYDNNYNQIIPNAIIAVDALTAEIRFDYSASGYAVASNGGGLYITGSTSRLDQTSAAVTWSFTHNLNTKYPAFEVYDSNDFVVIPSGIRVINENSAELYFAAPSTGKAIANFSGINGAPNATTASYSVTSEWNGLNAKPISSSLGTATAASTTVVASVATASYSAAFFDYAVISGSNSRAGTVMSVWNGGTVEYTDTSTSDIGNTDQVTMSVDLSGANVRLKSTTTDAWTVKSLIRLI